jgi:hypothetical protein
MIPRDAEPVSHIRPYKRIAIGSETPAKPTFKVPESDASYRIRMMEADRVWKLVVQTATGTNDVASPSVPSDDIELTVGSRWRYSNGKWTLL